MFFLLPFLSLSRFRWCVRHGESTWNNENRFTGWKDVPLSEKGIKEAAQSGELIAESGLTFDVAYTSVLKVHT